MELACAGALALILAGVGLVDDIRALGAATRLAIHVLVASTAVAVSGWRVTDLGLPFVALALGPVASAVFPVLFTVAFINFFNFMDGINGLASVQAALAGAVLALLLSSHATVLAGAAAAVGGGALGFLPHNFPRARMFMGDVGSTTLGAALALLAVGGAATTEIPFVALCLPLGVFFYDALFTLGKRAWRRENIFVAHREHLYQLVLRSGWSHTQTTALMAALIGACCAAAVAYTHVGDAARAGLLMALVALAATFTWCVHRRREVPCVP
jgi:UDP-N-acetylmuramyl pentapeptide phosphotransferase/UDP-N-acetylglucosamine-1-phosphate transferase